MRFGNHFLICAAAIATALLFGGGTKPGFLSDVVLQVACIAVAVSCVLCSATNKDRKSLPRYAIAFCGAMILIPALQLFPLPPAIWAALPGQHLVTSALDVAELPLAWRPITVSANATWTSALALLPPLAIFFGTLLLTNNERRRMVLLILFIGISSAILGLLQVAHGPESALRFYAVTNPTEAVGFFANRNHFAALLYSLLLFAGAWMTEALPHNPNTTAKGFGTITPPLILYIAIALAVVIILISSQAMARSRAGIILSMVAIGLLLAIFASSSRKAAGTALTRVMLLALLLTFVFSTQFALYRILERFSNDPLKDARLVFVENTWKAMKAFFPFGSGLGTFVPVYGAFEKQEHAIPGIYANHAHNDLVELGLETGILGLALAALFSAWLVRTGVTVWFAKKPQNESALDTRLKQAAIFVMALLLAHSLVDYPLRTGALAVLFAFCCAMLFAPVPSKDDVTGRASKVPSGSSAQKPVEKRKQAAHSATEPQEYPKKRTPWANNVAWPDTWTSNRSEHNGDAESKNR